uniref:Jacalin-type lectin domain-containing protein n=1 Tax=Davidia involucrata TaxID=16924 RepID=A0A5B6YS50_DAVIN
MKNTLFKSSGPFGGKEGCQWDDGIYTTIRQLIIYSSSVIENIQIEYDEKGRSDWSKKHGESESGMINTVKLDYPGEYLRSITGHYSTKNQDIIVFSLTIESNRRTYGPFGTEEGDCFKFPPTTGNKIIGFHGSSGYYLNSIGAYFQPILDPSELITTEPFGGRGGNQWDDGIYTTIRQLIIFSSAAIDSIQIEYDEKGESKWSNRSGRKIGTKSTIKLDYPGEFLISVSGYFFNHHLKIVESLTIESNRSTYGPFGPQDETYFKFPSTSSGKIIGFHGRSGRYIDSIGAYIKPILDPGETTCHISPFGGVGGSSWDDGVHSTIRKLIIFTSEVISSIQIEYDDKGQSNWSETHGSERGTRNTVTLDYPNEFILLVSGHLHVESSLIVVGSLKFESNKGTYGPFGTEAGRFFKFPSISGKIIGFHGRCSDNLDSIGAYFEPLPNP